jgi:hypothetical protein
LPDLPESFWSDDKDAERISFFYWERANKNQKEMMYQSISASRSKRRVSSGPRACVILPCRDEAGSLVGKKAREEEQFPSFQQLYADSDTSAVEDNEALGLWDDPEYERRRRI